MSAWKILCDFDGTIVANDVTDHLLERFARPAWRDLERDWEQGRIGARECMQGQIALIDATPAVLDQAVAAMAADAEFPDFVALAQRMGIPLTIVSDGLDRVIKDVLRRIRLSNVETMSSRLEYGSDGHWHLEFPYAEANCLSMACTCKCAIARRDGLRTLLIGDGRSDFCLADTADFVFAKHKLLSYCEATQIPHAAFTGFADARRLLQHLVARTTAARSLEPVAHG